MAQAQVFKMPFWEKFLDQASGAAIGAIIAWLIASLTFTRKIDAAVAAKVTSIDERIAAINTRVSKFEAKVETLVTQSAFEKAFDKFEAALLRLEKKIDRRNDTGED